MKRDVVLLTGATYFIKMYLSTFSMLYIIVEYAYLCVYSITELKLYEASCQCVINGL